MTPWALFRNALAPHVEEAVLAGLAVVEQAAPPRAVFSPFGKMSVAITNAGDFGWYARRSGYDYIARDPVNDQPWPKMPDAWRDLAVRAAAAAGYLDFAPDSCLVNSYTAKAKLGLHQDKDERDFRQPIVSLSLGVSATFAWGGFTRSAEYERMVLDHGDVFVFGGPDRLRYHGIVDTFAGVHPKLGARRVNLTFRKAR